MKAPRILPLATIFPDSDESELAAVVLRSQKRRRRLCFYLCCPSGKSIRQSDRATSAVGPTATDIFAAGVALSPKWSKSGRRAMCGRLRVGKDFLHECSIGRCSHVFGLCVRFTCPLAIMPSADQVTVNRTHSTMLWPMWVVLIAGSTGSALRAVRPPNLHITPGCPV